MIKIKNGLISNIIVGAATAAITAGAILISKKIFNKKDDSATDTGNSATDMEIVDKE
jgi:hypothetical protein